MRIVVLLQTSPTERGAASCEHETRVSARVWPREHGTRTYSYDLIACTARRSRSTLENLVPHGVTVCVPLVHFHTCSGCHGAVPAERECNVRLRLQRELSEEMIEVQGGVARPRRT